MIKSATILLTLICIWICFEALLASTTPKRKKKERDRSEGKGEDAEKTEDSTRFSCAVWVFFLFGQSLAGDCATTDSEKSLSRRPGSFVVCLDESQSMSSASRFEAAKEALKLIVGLVDQEIHLCTFSDDARISQLSLRNDADKKAAVQRIDRLRPARGSTNYLATLKAISSVADSPTVLWISDGAPTKGTRSELMEEVRRFSGRIFTIAIDADSVAEELLADMSAATGGSALKVAKPKELVEALLKTALSATGEYRVHKPVGGTHALVSVAADLIVLGYGTNLEVEGDPDLPPPLYEYMAYFDAPVHLVRHKLTTPTSVEISSSRPSGHVGILRNDLSIARMTLRDHAGRPLKIPVATNAPFHVEFEFDDPDLVRSGLARAEVLLMTSDGTSVLTTAAIAEADGRLHAEITMPSKPGTWKVEGVSTDLSTGLPFDAHHAVTIRSEIVKFQGLQPQLGEISLGAFFAQAGLKELSNLEITSLDLKPFTYEIAVVDLACATSALPTTASATRVTPIRVNRPK